MRTASQAKIKNNNYGSIRVLLGGVSLVTLYFNTSLQDPFNTPKLIILLFTSGWLLGHIISYYRKTPVNFKSTEFITLVLLMVFVSTLLISLLNTDIFIIGLVGDTQRRNGFLSYFALSILLLFCALKINYMHSIRVIKTTILVGLILSGYGLLQITGNDFVEWDNPYNSMIATVGNPNFASSLLALISVIALYSLGINSLGVFYKIISSILIILGIVLIINSQSRQGLLVVLFSILFYIVVYVHFNLTKYRLFVFAIAGLLASFTVLGMLQIGPLTAFLYKNSVSVRGFYWRAAYEMFLDRPLTGVGLDRYGAYFKEYREVGYALNYGFDITSSNAHNLFLQFFSTGGLLVGLSYLTLMFFILFTGLKNVSNSQGNQQRINLLFISSWVGFQAQSLISIDNIGISIWGWLIGGCILGLSRIENNNAVTVERKTDNKKNTSHISLFQPVISTIIIIPVFFVAINLLRIESHTFFTRAYFNPNMSQNNTLVLDLARKVLKNSSSDPYYKYLVAMHMIDAGAVNEGYTAILSLHLEDPRNLNVLLWLANYEKYNQKNDQAIYFRSQIVGLDPWNAENYLELGNLYKIIGDLPNSKKMREKILNFAPGTEVAQRAQAELG